MGANPVQSLELPQVYMLKEQKTKFSQEYPLMGQDAITGSQMDSSIKASLFAEANGVDLNGNHCRDGLFASLLSEIFDNKLRLLTKGVRLGQSIDTVDSNYEEDEPFESTGEIEAQFIGNLLPDDDDLLSGVFDDIGYIGRPNSGDDIDDDIFCTGGGLELEADENVNGSSVCDFNGGLDSNGLQVGPNGPFLGEHPYGEHPSRTLFVRNINSNVEDTELKALFEQYGDIRTLYTACKHRGFVMISYYDIRSAQNAMKALQNKPLRRRKLDIHFSIPKITDVWSCGVTLYVMLVGSYPFEDSEDPRNFRKTISIHWPFRVKKGSSISPENFVQPDILATWGAMEKLYDSGKARAIGVSNFASKKLEDLLAIARVPPAVDQVECHPGWQQTKLHALCQAKGVHLSAYSPLGSPGTTFIKGWHYKHLNKYGEAGLRTLALAYRVLEESEYLAWNAEFFKAKTSIGSDRESQLERVSDLIERELILIGATAVEDKLQRGVPQCIDKLAQAGLKIWVLTDDKMETAINIGYACSLLRQGMKQICLSATNDLLAQDVKKATKESLLMQITNALQMVNLEKDPHAAFALIIDGKALTYALEEDMKD